MDLAGAGRVGANELIKIIDDTNPTKAVGEVIKQLNKDIERIDEEIKKACLEDKEKLRRIEHKLTEAAAGLKSGQNIDDILMELKGIKQLDPQAYAQLQPVIEKLEKISDYIRKMHAQKVNVMSSGVVV